MTHMETIVSENDATAASNGQKQATTAAMVDDDDLFELDIASLSRRDDAGGDDHSRRHRSSHCAAVPDDDDGGGHALLANCLLPVSSVSNAVSVTASSIASTSYPYSGYHSSRRLFTGGGGRRFLGRSARFCFSSRGFETMGNYFQRY